MALSLVYYWPYLQDMTNNIFERHSLPTGKLSHQLQEYDDNCNDIWLRNSVTILQLSFYCVRVLAMVSLEYNKFHQSITATIATFLSQNIKCVPATYSEGLPYLLIYHFTILLQSLSTLPMGTGNKLQGGANTLRF
jgi:hypothetical protein